MERPPLVMILVRCKRCLAKIAGLGVERRQSVERPVTGFVACVGKLEQDCEGYNDVHWSAWSLLYTELKLVRGFVECQGARARVFPETDGPHAMINTTVAAWLEEISLHVFSSVPHGYT